MTRTLGDQPIHGPMVWHGQELARSTDWIRKLSPAAVEEIDAALQGVERRGLGWPEIRKADFPLPGVSALLAQVNRDLEWGRGLVLLRGLPVERYSRPTSCARSGGGSAATWAPRSTRTPTAS